jgi:hypothetical protein
MTTSRKEPVFLDTTIMIARLVHSPERRRNIERRLAKHSEKVTSLGVRQEFKRRLLREADYLLRKLNELGSVVRMRRHIHERLPPKQGRKRNICEALIQTVDEQDGNEDLTDRLKLFLHGLLRDGLDDFDEGVDRLITDSGCACGKLNSLREEKCSKVPQQCGIVNFLESRRTQAEAILVRLRRLRAGKNGSEKTPELTKAQAFLEKVIKNPADARKENPCLAVGDAVIALESCGVGTFYTMNRAESQHLAPPLNQTLIIRLANPELDDEVLPSATRPSDPS